MGGPWDKPNMDSESGKARWSARGNPEEIPHMSDSSYHEGATLSLSPPVCLSTHTLFPPNKHFTCFTTFCLFVGIHFYKADRPGALSLATGPRGLVARIQLSHWRGLTSISGWGNEILLQAAAGRGHPRTLPLASSPGTKPTFSSNCPVLAHFRRMQLTAAFLQSSTGEEDYNRQCQCFIWICSDSYYQNMLQALSEALHFQAIQGHIADKGELCRMCQTQVVFDRGLSILSKTSFINERDQQSYL